MSDTQSRSNPHLTLTAPPEPAVQRLSPAEMCGRPITSMSWTVANENTPTAEGLLFQQLPAVIREAIDEWADFLKARPWRFRREVMHRFAGIFADQFRMHSPKMSEEEYQGMKEIGFTCLLERLDGGERITSLHQARLFMESVHDRHRDAARVYLAANQPQSIAVH